MPQEQQLRSLETVGAWRVHVVNKLLHAGRRLLYRLWVGQMADTVHTCKDANRNVYVQTRSWMV